jgi:hypothetical protein
MTPKSVVDYSYAFMFACLGFNTLKDAERYRRESGNNFSSDIEPLFKTDKFGYVVNEWPDTFSTGLFHDHRFSSKPMWHTLRRKDTPKPAGAYNVALMYEGPSKIYLADRICDCCVVWNRTDGKPLKSIWGDHKRALYVGRSGSGAMYARVLRYRNGRPAEMETHFYALDFTILDRDPSKDDMLRVTLTASSTEFSRNPDMIMEPDQFNDYSPMLKTMLNQARNGFNQLCKPNDVEGERRMNYYNEQLLKWRSDHDKYHQWADKDDSYYRKIKNMGYKEALDTVEEAWQMARVVEAHWLHPDCWEAYPNYSGSMCKCVYNMLAKYKPSPERSRKLTEMLDLFVARIMGSSWNYDD